MTKGKGMIPMKSDRELRFRARIAAHLADGWRRYVLKFGSAPEGTFAELFMLLEGRPLAGRGREPAPRILGKVT